MKSPQHAKPSSTPLEPSPLLFKVFDEHEAHYGEPSMHYRFDPESPKAALRWMDVFSWRPTDKTDVTTLATVGMSDRAMEGAEHRAELHLTVRGALDDAAEQALATFLANMASYPHNAGAALDWWHILTDVGAPPGFAHCPHGLLHPRFTPDGWDQIDDAEGQTVRLLNYVPFSAGELDLARRVGLHPALDRMFRSGVDLFADRRG